MSIALHDLPIDAKETLLRGYGMASGQLQKLVPAMRVFNCLNYAPQVSEAIRSGDRSRLNTIRLRFNGAFDLFAL